jgi:hypothetical protein
MNSRRLSFIFSALLLITFIVTSVYAEGDEKNKNNTLNKTLGSPVRAYYNINDISTVFKNTGISDIDVDEANSGLVYPKGSGKTAVFQSGFLWGGYRADDPNRTPQVGGTAYREGLQGGKITNSGLPWPQLTAELETADNVRMYRVRRDVYPGGPFVDLSQDATIEANSAEAIRAQYELDWTNWPAADGAPFEDVDLNGIYDPTVDIPGVPGADQTLWHVANDLNPSRVQNLYGANPFGIEQQATYWGYKQAGALGSMFFRKYKIINKSSVGIDSMYVSMWSDVDLGNATDDFAGSDSLLSLGYCYNAGATDATYNPLPPPAVGFDFFQGPMVNGTPLPMTAYYYFARGDANLTDPTQGSAEGSVQFYNFFRGRIGRSGEPFTDPQGNVTPFALYGDPQTGTGWLDGQNLPSGDRRIGSASGPFNMAPGDTQEIVVAEIVAGAIPGVDRISAVGLLKYYDQFAQFAYDNNFDLPVPPPAPQVSIPGNFDPALGVYYALDEQIVLDWGEDPTKVSDTENYESKGHTFQGYNVYQLPSASATVSEGIRLATFDVADGVLKVNDAVFDVATGSVIVKPVQFGNDTGIRRFIEINSDAIKGGTPLINGIRYYFAVTAYSYNPNVPVGKSLENPIRTFTIIPQSPLPGQVSNSYLDTLAVTRTAGGSDGNLFPVVIDPSELTGLNYTVSFDTLAGGVIVWNVDRSDGVRVLANQTNQSADIESPIADGIQFRVIGAPNDFKRFSVVANASGPLDPFAAGSFHFAGFPTPDDLDPVSGVQQSTNASRWGIHTADNGARGDYASFLGRTTRDGASWPLIIPNDFELRFTATGGWAYDAFNTGTASFQVPFELWNIGIGTPDDPSDDYRMIPWLLDDDASGTFNLPLPGTKGFGTDDHSVSGGDNDPYTDWIYWAAPENSAPGQAGYLSAEALMQAQTYDGGNDHEVMARMVLVEWNGGAAPPYIADMPETGTIFRIESTKPNVPNSDVFTFSTQQASIDNELAKTKLEEINAFPNPYYGVNSEEINKYNRFVTFTHLPAKATIRIFNLAGILVKTINKDDAGQYQRWDLANESGLPVASGLYIVHIELPELGENKILKVAIIQEQQILDRF